MNGFEHIKFDERGLIPVVVQDWRDASVLMLAYMNREALEKTVTTGSVHFWSRSRQRLWEKGETSGHRLRLKEVFLDCDGDTLLVKAEPDGPTCHTGRPSCFFRDFTEVQPVTACPRASGGGVLERVMETIEARRTAPKAESYVAGLLQDDADRMLKKVVEEAGEVILASKDGRREGVVHEVADLLFHSLVVLAAHQIPLAAIYQELARRFGQSGLARKKERTSP